MRRHSFLTILVFGLLVPTASIARVSVTDLRIVETSLDRIDAPALSPTGDRIAFSAPGTDGGIHLYVMSSSGGPATQLTTGSALDLGPVFSPDGDRIAFVSNRSGNRDIWIVPAAGGEPKRVTDDPADDIDPTWSPDGKRLAFSSTRGGPLLLYQVTLSDNQAYMITAGTGADRRPAWSPDGSLIAFESTRNGKRHIWLIPPEGGEARLALPNDQGREESSPAWLPERGRLVVHANLARAPGRLWIVSLDTDPVGMEQLVLPPVPGGEPGQSAPVPSISRDGQHMVFVGGGVATIEMIAVTGGMPVKIVSSEGRLSHPSWSPEGRRLVVSGELGGSWDLWLAGISSGRVTRLTSDEEREQEPVWSKTTGDVLFTVREGADESIRMLEPESQRTIRLSPPPTAGPQSDSDPAWSPDGRSVAFASSRAGSPDLWVVASGGGEARRLTALPGAETHPTWSPDGSTIAFARDQGHGSEIWKIPAAGGDPIRLTSLPEGVVGDTQPVWSPAGTWIAFTRSMAEPAGASDLYIIPPDGGKPFPLRRGSGARIAEPAWSPDGAHIAYSYSLPDKLAIADLGDPQRTDSAPETTGAAPNVLGTPEGLKRLMEQRQEELKKQQEQEKQKTKPDGSPAEDPNGSG